MILTIAAVSAAMTLLVEVAKYAVKKTKTKTDDKVVAFIADHADDIVRYVVSRSSAKSDKPAVEPRAKVIDHRSGN